MGDDASVHGAQRGRNRGVGNGAGALETDAEGAGLRLEGGLQGAFADENESDGGELGEGEGFDEEVEAVPLDQPAGKAKL